MVAEQQPAEPVERFWTAKEWSQRTRVPYRAILGAAGRGELAAMRPSRGRRGVILISESSWATWLAGSQMRVRVTRPFESGSEQLDELAIGPSR